MWRWGRRIPIGQISWVVVKEYVIPVILQLLSFLPGLPSPGKVVVIIFLTLGCRFEERESKNNNYTLS